MSGVKIPEVLIPEKYTGTLEQKASIPYGTYLVVRKENLFIKDFLYLTK